MYWPYVQLGCNLEINSQRTKAYLDSACDTCDPGDLQTQIDLKCGCDPLFWVIPDDGSNPLPAVYTNPSSDQCAWFDASIPESAQFLGFLIEDVVQNSVTARNITTRVSSSGGGTLGPVRNKERKLDFTVLMFACNELAMNYGFRYLTDALNSPGCDDNCTLCDAEFRDSCPQVDGTLPSLNKGRWILKNVGCVSGPDNDQPVLGGGSCNVRRVKFSLVSEFPWKFKCPVVELTNAPFADYPAPGESCADWTDILCGQQETSVSVSENLIIGETGLIISIKAGTAPLEHIQIAVRPDKFGYECDASSRPAGYVRQTPCDLIVIPRIPGSSTLVYDTVTESITITLPGGGVIDGSSFISTNVGRPPSFPTLRCGNFCISASVSECSSTGASMSVSSVHREI